MPARQPIGDVLDALLDGGSRERSPVPPAARTRPRSVSAPVAETADGGTPRERITVALDLDLLESARNAAFYTPGLALRDLVEAGLKREIARLEKERGEAFPRRTAELRPGRKIR